MNMGHARTAAGACRRVIMKRALRRKGFKVAGEVTNKKLEKMYRSHVGTPPTYKESQRKCRIKWP